MLNKMQNSPIPSNLSDSYFSKRKGCVTTGFHAQGVCEEELNLSLSVGWTSRSFVDGSSSLVSTTFPHASTEAEGGSLPVDLELGLTMRNGQGILRTHPTFQQSFLSQRTYSESAESFIDADEERAQNKDTGILRCHYGGFISVEYSDKSTSNIYLSSSLDTNLQLGLSRGSDLVSDVKLSAKRQEIRAGPLFDHHVSIVDEGSTSGRQMNLKSCATLNPVETLIDVKESASSIYKDVSISSGGASRQITKTRLSSGHGPCTNSSDKLLLKACKFKGCNKGARGASGLCIAHGGGRRCQKPDCKKGAEGRTMFCKAHGGGRRCQFFGCIKSAEGKTDLCIAHGGGRRCSHDGCKKAARGKSGLCIRHGGGKRCQKEGCTRSAEGLAGLCISHGGGRRCQYPSCGKGAQGSTKFCKAHGGGRRCQFEGCTKGAEGSTAFCKGHGGGKRCTYAGGTCTKSVHGGTLFCVAHGGGKRCAAPDCTKSARGRTYYCVRHGGGKRCKFEGCSKSAQGSTDFCKAHGGGKRCCWDQEGSIYDGNALDVHGLGSLRGPCDRFARGKTGLCSAHNALLEQFDTSKHHASNATKSGSYNREVISASDLTDQSSQFETDQSIVERCSMEASSSQPIGNRTDGHCPYWISSNISSKHYDSKVVNSHLSQHENLFSSKHHIVFPAMASHLWHSTPDDAVCDASSMSSFNNLEERVHGGSHIKALLAENIQV